VILGDLAAVAGAGTAGDHCAKLRREHVPRAAQPVSPGPVLLRLIYQALAAHIENHSADPPATLRQTATYPAACFCGDPMAVLL